MDGRIDMAGVIATLALPYEPRSSSGTYTCPVCGGRRKFNINFQKGVFNCPKCGFKGSAFDLWAYFRGISAPDRATLCRLVAKDFYAYTGDDARPEKKASAKKPLPRIQQFELAEEDVLDSTFTALLDGLCLSEGHLHALEARGLPSSVIEANGYKTAPTVGSRQIAHRLLSDGHVTEGVPGFYKKASWSFVNYGPGFLIPCRSINGRIHGLQLRTDKKTYKKSRALALKCSGSALKGRLRPASGTLKRRPKYLTLSSAEKPFGTKGTTKPHYNPGLGGRDVVLTEGPLKGDIISHFTGMSCLAVLGVNSLSQLPQMLSQLRDVGKTRILIAFDMDMYTNPYVEAAFRNLEAIIAHMGFRYAKVEWNPAFKGYDDWLARP